MLRLWPSVLLDALDREDDPPAVLDEDEDAETWLDALLPDADELAEDAP